MQITDLTFLARKSSEG